MAAITARTTPGAARSFWHRGVGRARLGWRAALVALLAFGMPSSCKRSDAPESGPAPSASTAPPLPADPCIEKRTADGRQRVVCHLREVDDGLARALGARPDRESLELVLSSASSRELSSVAKIPWAEHVTISVDASAVVDLRTLRPLRKLKTLTVVGGSVREVEDAWGFVELEELSAHERGSVELSGAARLRRLRWLRVGPELVSLEPLSSLTSLTYVGLPGRWASLEPLRPLERLDALSVTVERTADLSPLGALPALRELSIRGANLERLASALAGTASFSRLFLEGDTQVKDVRPLVKLRQLELLDLSGTRVSDVEPLAKLPQLEELKLWGTRVRAPHSLAGSSSLRRVLLPADTPESEIAALKQARPDLEIR